MTKAFAVVLVGAGLILTGPARAEIVSEDYMIDSVDEGIELFVRRKQDSTTAEATADNVVLFVHGATYPSTPDFDLQFEDYSWADWMAQNGYIVYLFDKRNYGFSTRQPEMDQPASQNEPLSRSYLVIRDLGAVVDHIREEEGVEKVHLIGWSWGAMTAGYYTSLHSDKVNKLVMYAPLYAYSLHTNLGPGSGLQDKRNPSQFNPELGAYRLATTEGTQNRWDGEIPVEDKSQYRDPAVIEAFMAEVFETDPTSSDREPKSARAPNGVLEDSFYQATGRRIFNASSIYVPVLVIAGEYDTWSFPADREVLIRDLVNAPEVEHVTIPDSTHFVVFEKPRFTLFEETDAFLKE